MYSNKILFDGYISGKVHDFQERNLWGPTKHTIKSDHLLYDKWDPVFIVLRIVGMFPISRGKSATCIRSYEIKEEGLYFSKFLPLLTCYATIAGSFYVSYKSGAFIISTVISTMTTLISVIAAFYELPQLALADVTFEDGILMYVNCLSFILFILPWMALFESRKLAMFFNNITAIEGVLSRVTKSKMTHSKPKRRNQLVMITIIFVLSYFHYLGKVAMDEQLKKYHITTYLINDIAFSKGVIFPLIFLSLIMLWRALNVALTCCTQHLLHDIESFQWVATGKLSAHFRAWQQLAVLHEEMGNAMGFTLAILCAALYFTGLTSLFLGSVNIKATVSPLVFSITVLIFITLILDHGHTSTAMIGKEFHNRLINLLRNKRVFGFENEIQQFAKDIIAFNPEIYLGGFFKVDRSVNAALYSSMVTYFIVLIQMKGDNTSTVCGATPTAHGAVGLATTDNTKFHT